MQILLNIQLTKSVKDPDRSSCVLIFRLRRRFPRFISSPLTLTWRQRLRRLNCCLQKTFGSNVPSGCHYNNIMIFRSTKMCFILSFENQNFFQCSSSQSKLNFRNLGNVPWKSQRGAKTRKKLPFLQNTLKDTNFETGESRSRFSTQFSCDDIFFIFHV